MITEPARLAETSVDLGKISPTRDENFSYDRDGLFICVRAIQTYDFKTKQTLAPKLFDHVM